MATKEEIRSLLADQTNNLKDILANTKADILNVMNGMISEVKQGLANDESDYTALESKVTKLEDQVARLTKNNDVIIHHVPFFPDENLETLFNHISTAIGFKIVCMTHLHRLSYKFKNKPAGIQPAKQPAVRVRDTRSKKNSQIDAVISDTHNDSSISSPGIMVKFGSWLDKSHFMQLYFKFKILDLTHIGFNTPKRIIIGDNLTSSNHKIFKAAVALKKSGKIYKIRVTDGLVSVSTDTASKFVRLSTVEELLSLSSGSSTCI